MVKVNNPVDTLGQDLVVAWMTVDESELVNGFNKRMYLANAQLGDSSNTKG